MNKVEPDSVNQSGQSSRVVLARSSCPDDQTCYLRVLSSSQNQLFINLCLYDLHYLNFYTQYHYKNNYIYAYELNSTNPAFWIYTKTADWNIFYDVIKPREIFSKMIDRFTQKDCLNDTKVHIYYLHSFDIAQVPYVNRYQIFDSFLSAQTS